MKPASNTAFALLFGSPAASAAALGSVMEQACATAKAAALRAVDDYQLSQASMVHHQQRAMEQQREAALQRAIYQARRRATYPARSRP
jgi:hypothetical protein